jgi:hypothetical protein
MSQNPDAVVNQGEFQGHVKPSEPMMKSGVSIMFTVSLFSLFSHYHNLVPCP